MLVWHRRCCWAFVCVCAAVVVEQWWPIYEKLICCVQFICIKHACTTPQTNTHTLAFVLGTLVGIALTFEFCVILVRKRAPTWLWPRAALKFFTVKSRLVLVSTFVFTLKRQACAQWDEGNLWTCVPLPPRTHASVCLRLNWQKPLSSLQLTDDLQSIDWLYLIWVNANWVAFNFIPLLSGVFAVVAAARNNALPLLRCVGLEQYYWINSKTII